MFVANEFAAMWGADPGSLAPASQGINHVYRFEIKGSGYYLRIANPSVRALKDVVAATDFLLCLAEQGAPVCEPVASRSGRFIEEFELAGTNYVATALAEVKGTRIDPVHVGDALCVYLGQSLAEMHAAAKNYEPAPGVHFLSWRDLWHEVDSHLDKSDGELCQVYQEVDTWANSLPSSSESFGLIHGDYRLDNLIAQGDRVCALDFDEPIYHWFAADLARVLTDFYGQPIEKRRQVRDALVKGYRNVLPFDDKMVKALPHFMRMKELDRYTWTLTMWQNPTIPGGQARDEALHSMRALILDPQII